MSKNIFHSALCKEGEVEITVTADSPQKSKFGKEDYFPIKIGGEEHYYPVENDDIAETLSGHKGKTLLIVASGRGDEATVEILREGSTTTRQPASAHRGAGSGTSAGRAAEPPPRLTAAEREAAALKEFKRANLMCAQSAILFRMALRKASQLLSYEGVEPDFEDVRAVATTIYIDVKSMVDVRGLPVAWPAETAAPQPEARRAAAPLPLLEPEPDDDSDTIPF